MNKTVIGVFGFILLLIAIALPFLHLEQSKGDALPLLIAVLVAPVACALLVLAIKPEWFRRYLIALAALFGLAVVMFFVGLFSKF
jgi:multisubunit Na+/H+ antiporter MnhG subunit